MKILFHSNLFPDDREVYRGQDNANLLHRLAESAEVRVISPRPLLPFRTPPPVRAREQDARFKPIFRHFRYIPKVGSSVNHHLLRAAVRKPFEDLVSTFQPDVLLASWAYPDTCAVVPIAQEFGLPVVAITQGSDVHIHLRMPLRRRLIPKAFAHCYKVITRSAQLAQLLEDAGVSREKLQPVYNGVDSSVFYPGNTEAIRQNLGLSVSSRYLLFVGNYYPVKNPVLLLQAVAKLRQTVSGYDIKLLMVGEGPLQDKVESTLRKLGLTDIVTLLGRQSSAQVADLMRSVDILCIPSNNEGLPNVLLEAFSCGLQVVSTDVGGIKEVLKDSSLGQLVPAGDSDRMAQAIHDRLSSTTDKELILRLAEPFSWQRTVVIYRRILESAISSN